MDWICYLGYKSKTSVTQTDQFDWWGPIYLDGLSAVCKFIFPQVLILHQRFRCGPGQGCQPPCSYLILNPDLSHDIGNLPAPHVCQICIESLYLFLHARLRVLCVGSEGHTVTHLQVKHVMHDAAGYVHS